MKKIIYIILVSLLFTTISCEQAFMEEHPETDNKTIFNEYVKLVKEKYAMLAFKNVDINALETSIGATINGNTSEAELFDKLGVITQALRDGHSDLSYGENFKGYDFIDGYPAGINIGILIANYIGKIVNPNINIIYKEDSTEEFTVIYGFLPQDNDIAYIWIPSWDVTITDEQIETVFNSIKDAKGLIFDMRQNTGGDPSLATKFASYLMEGSAVYTGFERFKTGPGTSDFSDSQVYLQEADSNVKFLKPTAVLTDRYCYSASTTFAYSTNPLPNVTFIGQRTGGGSGSVADGFLANGWKWSLSTSEFIDHLGNHLDDGFDPDIPVALDLNDTTKDEVIERAILELQ